jgi:F-type H+-transporting ATPase subunit a
MHISLVAETLTHIFGFPITNTLFTVWLVMLFLIIGAVLINKKLVASGTPSGIQNIAETVVEGLFDFFATIAGSRKDAKRFFPIVATIFILILASNWAGILPGVGTIGFYEEAESAVVVEHATEGEAPATAAHEGENTHEGPVFVPFFRSVNSDLNMTLALALIAVTLSHYFGIAALGALSHAGKFFTLKSPILLFAGILEFIGEFAKIISFSFRLFGNVFAGEILLVIISFLVPYVAPVPFYGLELFVGLVQALVFSVLTMMFLVTATKHH